MSKQPVLGQTRPSAFAQFLVGTSIALALLVVVLSNQNRALRRALAQEEENDARPTQLAARFLPGEIVPPLRLLERDGSVATIAFGAEGKRTLLLFYAEACKVCPQVFLSWEELVPQFRAEGLRVAAVQLDRTGTSAAYGPPDVASFALADFSAVPLMKIATVPLTLLLDEKGVVEWAHYGTFTDMDMSALIAFLPGG